MCTNDSVWVDFMLTASQLLDCDVLLTLVLFWGNPGIWRVEANDCLSEILLQHRKPTWPKCRASVPYLSLALPFSFWKRRLVLADNEVSSALSMKLYVASVDVVGSLAFSVQNRLLSSSELIYQSMRGFFIWGINNILMTFGAAPHHILNHD